MADICRTTGRNSDFTKHLSVHFVETSPTLRAEQKQRVPNASWHDSIATLPENAMTLVIANEFFDALPITQYARTKPAGEKLPLPWKIMNWLSARARAEKSFLAVQAALCPTPHPGDY